MPILYEIRPTKPCKIRGMEARNLVQKVGHCQRSCLASRSAVEEAISETKYICDKKLSSLSVSENYFGSSIPKSP